MVRSTTLFAWGFVLCTAGILISLNGCGGGGGAPSTTPPPTQKIQHVVIIFQENRTPDNLFQDPNLVAKGADIQSYGINSSGEKITLQPQSLGVDYDLSHAHSAFLEMYDGGKMDGADKIQVLCKPSDCSPPPPPNPQFWSTDPSQLGPYFQLAETYTFGDRMFQTDQGPSFPAHQYIISGTSAPSATSTSFVAENPAGNPLFFTDAGCTAPPDEYVALINPSGQETSTMYPCFDHPTLTDQFDAKNISWKYYAPGPGWIWTAPNAIQHMCVPNAPIPNATACTGSDWVNHVVLDQTQVLTDIAAGNLSSVTWVIPNGQSSDHASFPDGTEGPSWVASVVNAIGNSQFWSSTAIIIAWDDWGGWYDHVAPPIDSTYGYYEYGFRVPLIVVSPYAKAGYISHVQHDFGSILKFTEEQFNLTTVAPGYADTRSDDLSDCFDFTQTPLTFQTIKAEKDASYFINDKRPPQPPDDD